jgi:hypothetical protein
MARVQEMKYHFVLWHQLWKEKLESNSIPNTDQEQTATLLSITLSQYRVTGIPFQYLLANQIGSHPKSGIPA